MATLICIIVDDALLDEFDELSKMIKIKREEALVKLMQHAVALSKAINLKEYIESSKNTYGDL